MMTFRRRSVNGVSDRIKSCSLHLWQRRRIPNEVADSLSNVTSDLFRIRRYTIPTVIACLQR